MKFKCGKKGSEHNFFPAFIMRENHMREIKRSIFFLHARKKALRSTLFPWNTGKRPPTVKIILFAIFHAFYPRFVTLWTRNDISSFYRPDKHKHTVDYDYDNSSLYLLLLFECSKLNGGWVACADFRLTLLWNFFALFHEDGREWSI